MSLEQDLADARRAVDDLEQACLMVSRHYQDTVDARRLRVDVTRLREDLTLLCGADRAYGHAGPSTFAFWSDADDEGVGGSGRTLR
jgi:hypothetical protein